MPYRTCGGQCPPINVSPSTTMKCRHCKKDFHMPCYNILTSLNKVFTHNNIVFICDACLDELDGMNSPGRKRKTSSILKDSSFSPNVNGFGKQSMQQQQHVQQSENSLLKQNTSNESLHEILMSVSKKLDEQTNKMDKLSENVDCIGKGVMQTYKKTEEA